MSRIVSTLVKTLAMRSSLRALAAVASSASSSATAASTPSSSASASASTSSTTSTSDSKSKSKSKSTPIIFGPTETTPNYPEHVPLSVWQNSLLALGSGIVGVIDVERGDLIASLSESTSSTFLPTLHQKMVLHPEGRQILRDRPEISSESLERDGLRSMKRGTLGREYFEWLQRGNLTPDTRGQVQYIDSPTLAYTMLRYRQTHDLYHTLFSLPPTLPHELSLKVVEFSNMSLPVALLSSIFGPLRLKRRETWVRDWVPWALRTGQEGKSLVGVYWEKRWEQGLGELRRELGVKRNNIQGVEGRWKGYKELRDMERALRRKGEWIDEPEDW